MAFMIGVAAVVLSLIAIPVPVLGIFIGWLALGLATIAALRGYTLLALAVVVISVINYVFLSPSLWLSALSSTDRNWIEISMFMVAAPVFGLIARKLFARPKA